MFKIRRTLLAVIVLMAVSAWLIAAPPGAKRHRGHNHNYHRGSAKGLANSVPDRLMASVYFESDGAKLRNDGEKPPARLSTAATVGFVNAHQDNLSMFTIVKMQANDLRMIAADMLRVNNKPLVMTNVSSYRFGVNYQARPGWSPGDAKKEGEFLATSANMMIQQANDEVSRRK